MSKKLSPEEIEKSQAELTGWSVKDQKLVKTYKRKDFADAVSFIVQLGFVCEKHDHHPELSNVWNKVTLEITTHDAGNQLTGKDFALAKAIDEVA
ncbi:MAG: 4a-hydroxytetrahydrobiopterin dehydratase [Opitutales bacterium]|nr:4a-hydroxytetrahydrobiopterin dehydratase [Opitutales bacterium]MCH8540166.1 4a-hydroxytetrahydrobiopterin dehydratase [Opitutales bacterium]